MVARVVAEMETTLVVATAKAMAPVEVRRKPA